MKKIMLKDDLKAILAQNVTRIRMRLDLSLSDVARRASCEGYNCYPANIEQVESGQHMPGAYVVCRLAVALGVTPNDLLSFSTCKAHGSPGKILQKTC